MPWLPEAHERITTTHHRRPQPGDLVRRRFYLGPVALWNGPGGWWVQIWLAGPCRHGQRYTNARDLWIGQRVRVIRSATVLP